MPTFQSAGKPIRLDVHLPATPGPHPAILLLHGSGGNITFWLDRIAPFLSRLGIALFAPHYFDRTGTTRADPATLQDGIHVPIWIETVQDALTHIAALPNVDRSRIALVGISLGAFLSLALATRPNLPIRAVVDLSGGLVPPYQAHATPAFPPTLILHGEADTVVPVALAHALDTLLTRLGVQHETVLLPGEGHWFSSAAQFRILTAVAAFLGKHL